MEKEKKGIGFFERYLTVWVAICIVVGIAIGQWFPAIPETLGKFEYANVSIPVAILIWLMIYPMMMKVDFQSIKNVGKKPKGVFITCIVNWLIKPFTMFGIAWIFFFVIFKQWIPEALAGEYLAGAVLLGAAPCTAMVFVWSYLTKGDAAYTLVQVAVNDLLILVTFAPIVAFLLGVGGITIPWDTLTLSVILFVVIPLAGGVITRRTVISKKGEDYFNNVFIKKFDNATIIGLLLTLIILFSFQGETILVNPLHILLIAVPLIIQTFFIFLLAYGWSKASGLPHNVAAPAGMIGASNFFELAVAVAISLFGIQSGAALATVVGVLVEVPASVEENVMTEQGQRQGRCIQDRPIQKQCIQYPVQGTTLQDVHYGSVHTALGGVWQRENLSLALAVLKLLEESDYSITKEAVQSGIAKTIWHGRYEVLQTEPLFIIDGAHNPIAAKRLKQTIEKDFTNREIIYIIGVLADKEHEKMLRLLLPGAKAVFTVTPDSPRALDGESLAKEAQKYADNIWYVPDIGKAVKMAKETAKESDVILAVGSLSYLKEVKKALGQG